jgi:hypothetical protein
LQVETCHLKMTWRRHVGLHLQSDKGTEMGRTGIACALILLSSGTIAEDTRWELRAGPAFHGLDANNNSFLHPFTTGRLEDLSVELLWQPPIDLSLIGSPRLQVGGTFNVRGMEQMAHLNLVWHVPVFTLPVYVEGGLGAAYVTGYLHNPPPGYRALGCNAMFYFQAAIGAELPADFTATLMAEHSSHAWLCGADNLGLNSLSLQLGHKF